MPAGSCRGPRARRPPLHIEAHRSFHLCETFKGACRSHLREAPESTRFPQMGPETAHATPARALAAGMQEVEEASAVDPQ